MPIVPSTWRLEDDVFTPAAKLRIDYSGPNPFRVVGPTMTLLRNILEIGSEDVWERDFRWDTTADPRPFFVRTYVNFKMDAPSIILVEIIFQGEQPSDPTKNGKLTINISGRLITKYELNAGWRKLPIYWAFLWLYHKIFYNKVRRGYLRIGQDKLQTVASAYRKLLGIPPVPFSESRVA